MGIDHGDLERMLRAGPLPGGPMIPSGRVEAVPARLRTEFHLSANVGYVGAASMPPPFSPVGNPEDVRILWMHLPQAEDGPLTQMVYFDRGGWTRFMESTVSACDEDRLDELERLIAQRRDAITPQDPPSDLLLPGD